MTTGYAGRGGWVCLPPVPDAARNAEFYALALPADRACCQGLLDASYNKVAGRQRFRVMLDHGFLTVVRAGKLSPLTPPFACEGTMSEVDIGFWLLVGSVPDGALLPDRLGWVPACLFVDNPLAAAAGREVWGFPKYHATIAAPEASKTGGPFEVSALAIARFGNAEHASVQPVLSLHGADLLFAGVPESAAETLRLLMRAEDSLFADIFGHADCNSILGASGLPVPVFYLKQFRAADDPDAACYQALLRGPLVLDTLRAFGLLSGRWQVVLNALDSLPFVRELGLGDAQDGKLIVTVQHAFWCDMDFTVGPASAF